MASEFHENEGLKWLIFHENEGLKWLIFHENEGLKWLIFHENEGLKGGSCTECVSQGEKKLVPRRRNMIH